VSVSRKILLAGVCGCLIGLMPYAWGRYRTATIIVPVSGTVTIDGQPLPHAYVKFMPVPRPGQNPLDGNPGSDAFTDLDGNFTLHQIANDRPGVIVGEHRILLRSGEPGPDGFVNERVPFSWRKGMRWYRVSWTGSREVVFQITTIDHYSPQSERSTASD
jgi:hypothetical protein